MGQSITIITEDSKVFINSAQVITTDIIVSNGVMHAIDNVLNPANATVAEDPTATTQPIADEGATSAASAPFARGIRATTTAPIAATGTNHKTGAGGRIVGGEGLGGVKAAVVGAAVMLL